MIPNEYENFFLASAGVSATLIGLLFVAVSVRPERIFGGEAAAEHFSVATSAFTAFINAFFISLGALLPSINLGIFVLVMGAFALLNTVGLGRWLGRRLWRGWRRGRRPHQTAGLVLFGLIIYGLELRYGWSLYRAPATGMAYTSDVSTLTILLLAVYGLGLGRSWELLGARRWGLLAWFLAPEEEDEAPSSRSDSKSDDRAP